jgi:hypothetical protein
MYVYYSRPVFNFAPKEEFWPLGVKLAPRCELCLSSKEKSVLTPGCERRGEHSPTGVKGHPWEPSSSLGANRDYLEVKVRLYVGAS